MSLLDDHINLFAYQMSSKNRIWQPTTPDDINCYSTSWNKSIILLDLSNKIVLDEAV